MVLHREQIIVGHDSCSADAGGQHRRNHANRCPRHRVLQVDVQVLSGYSCCYSFSRAPSSRDCLRVTDFEKLKPLQQWACRYVRVLAPAFNLAIDRGFQADPLGARAYDRQDARFDLEFGGVREARRDRVAIDRLAVLFVNLSTNAHKLVACILRDRGEPMHIRRSVEVDT